MNRAVTKSGSPRAEERSPWFTFGILLLSCFITIEAAAFQAPAIPTIAGYFGISASLAALISLIYYLGLVTFSPIFGRVADHYGRKKVLLLGLVAFIVSEFLAAMTPNYQLLLVCRFLQGLAVACILPVILSFLGYLFPKEKRGMPLGIMVFAMSLGAVTGAVIGGLIIDAMGWRAIYWVSGALAILGLLGVALFIEETPGVEEAYKPDLVGALLLLVGIAALLSTPTWISRYGFLSPTVLVSLVGGIVAFALLWRYEQRVTAPVFDVSIMRQRGFVVPGFIYLLLLICYGGTLYAMSFFINDRPDGNATQVGIVNTCAYGASMAAGLLGGKLADRYDERLLLFGVLAIIALGLGLYSQIGLHTPLWMLAAIIAVLGLAQGMKGPVITKLALNAVPSEKLSSGSGLFSMMRDFGTPAGVSIGLSIYSSVLQGNTRADLLQRAEQAGLDSTWDQVLLEGLADPSRVPQALVEELAARGTSFDVLAQSADFSGMGHTLPRVAMILYFVVFLALLLTLTLPRRTA